MPQFAFDHLEKIAATASKTEKEKLLKEGFAASPLLRRICLAAYDPFVTYGIARIPEFDAQDTYSLDMSNEIIWKLLDDLATRKLSGNEAIAQVKAALSVMPNSSRELFKRVLLRDLRAGFSENTINKAEKGAIKTFPYMRCTLPEKSNMAQWDWAAGIIVQLKADGMFLNLTRGQGTEAWATTRAGTPLPDNSPQMQAVLEAAGQTIPSNTQCHGEMTVYEVTPAGKALLSRKEGNGIINSMLTGEPLDPKYILVVDLWDMIPLEAVVPKGKYELGYKQRLTRLAKTLAGNNVDSLLRLVPTKIVRSKAEAFALYKAYLAAGLEGVICKHPELVWRDTGSGGEKNQVKLKLDFEVELEVYDFEPGTPGTKTEATFGSLKCRSCDDLLRVDVSGMTDEMRLDAHLNRESWKGSIITVRANDVIDREGTDIRSLFLPRFIERRLDKSTADSLAQIEAIKKAAMEAV